MRTSRGRDQELDRLDLQILKAVNGEGSVVNVVGEDDIGKSRLMAELKKREVVKRVMLLEGRAISMSRNLSFHPIIDLLKNWARIREDDGEAAAMNKLQESIRQVSVEEADEIFPFVAILMGMKLSGKYAERIKGIEGEALWNIWTSLGAWVASQRCPTLRVGATNYHMTIKWQDKLLKKRSQKGINYSNKPQGEVEIGAAPFRCGLIGYHLKLDSFLS